MLCLLPQADVDRGRLPETRTVPPHAGGARRASALFSERSTGGRRAVAALAATADDASAAKKQAPQTSQRRNSLRKASLNMRRAAEVVSVAAAAWPLTAMSFTLKKNNVRRPQRDLLVHFLRKGTVTCCCKFQHRAFATCTKLRAAPDPWLLPVPRVDPAKSMKRWTRCRA